jgi:hypothetical protein
VSDLHGATGRVFRDGVPIATFTLRDSRYVERLPGGKPGRTRGEVEIRFDDFDDDWARQLPRPLTGERRAVTSLSVDLAFDNGQNLLGCLVSTPRITPLGGPVVGLWFPIELPD